MGSSAVTKKTERLMAHAGRINCAVEEGVPVPGVHASSDRYVPPEISGKRGDHLELGLESRTGSTSSR